MLSRYSIKLLLYLGKILRENVGYKMANFFNKLQVKKDNHTLEVNRPRLNDGGEFDEHFRDTINVS